MYQSNGASPIDPAEMVAQATRTMEAAMKAAVKIQEVSAKWFAEVLSDMSSPQKWQKKAESVVDETLNVTQKNLDEAVRIMNQNAKTSLELFQKATELRQNGAKADPQAAAREWWETALGALRTNTQSLIQANNHILESWAELTKKFNGRAMEIAEVVTQHAENMTKQSTAANN